MEYIFCQSSNAEVLNNCWIFFFFF